MNRGIILTGLAALALSGASMSGSINTKQGITADGDIATKGDVTAQGQLVSNVRTGTPPIQVISTTRVDQLNAQYLDGMAAADFAGVSELATAGGGVSVHWKNIAGIPGEEIDQDCAVNTGCFTGDTPGFPVTITEPGSYRLASNLDVRGETIPENASGVEIESSDVTLDLNGFAIIGPVSCSGSPVNVCTPTGGSGRGIFTSSFPDNVTIKNGNVSGMGSDGIRCSGGACLVDHVSVAENDEDGMDLSEGSVFNSIARRNGESGIKVGGVIANNSARANGGNGFEVANGSVARGNTAYFNGGHGVSCLGCLLVDNYIVSNKDHGVAFSSGDSAYGRNLISANTLGTVDGTASDMGNNVCDGGACP